MSVGNNDCVSLGWGVYCCNKPRWCEKIMLLKCTTIRF